MRPIDAAAYGQGSVYRRSRSVDLRAAVIAIARPVDGIERAHVVFSLHLAPQMTSKRRWMCWKRIQECHADMIAVFVKPEHKIDPVILPERFPRRARKRA